MNRNFHRFVLMLALTPASAFAHHGQDFLLVESPGVPHLGSVHLLVNASSALNGKNEEQASFEPALLVGIAPRVSIELHGHLEKLRGQDWNYEAIAPAVHLQLTDPSKHDEWQVGIGVEYEFAAEKNTADSADVRLSFEKENGAAKWGANLIAHHEQGNAIDYGAAVGFREQVRKGIAIGAEAQSSFRHAAGSELLLTAYFEREQIISSASRGWHSNSVLAGNKRKTARSSSLPDSAWSCV
jgi:hypothetical protein